VSIVHYVANISEHVDGFTKAWSNFGVAQYYQFHLFADPDRTDRRPLVRGRQSTVGDEIFRGLFKHAFHSCDDHTPIFDDPVQRIRWKEITPSQRKPRNAPTLVQYKATIAKGEEQWGYSADQFSALRDMWELLNSEDPLQFHWLDSGLWPCIKGSIDEPAAAVGGASAPLTDHVRSSGRAPPVRAPVPALADSESGQLATHESLATRGPGQVLREDDVNPWDNGEVTARNKDFPWRGFAPEMMVLIEPDRASAEAESDGFWLGQLVDRPDDGVDRDDEKDFFVGVHWWGRKKTSSKRPWFEEKCKWEPQQGTKGPLIDTISIDTVGTEVKMNADGGFSKRELNLHNINYYRRLWFGMSDGVWTNGGPA
jgi:hypothetical protein